MNKKLFWYFSTFSWITFGWHDHLANRCALNKFAFLLLFSKLLVFFERNCLKKFNKSKQKLIFIHKEKVQQQPKGKKRWTWTFWTVFNQLFNCEIQNKLLLSLSLFLFSFGCLLGSDCKRVDQKSKSCSFGKLRFFKKRVECLWPLTKVCVSKRTNFNL